MALGGTITHSGGYTIHTFTSSGTFTPAGPMNVDLLLVAPGGGGAAGGAGAGGMREITAIAVTAQNYTITCATYGSGRVVTAAGYDGGDSSALGYTNIGGGGAGYYNGGNGRYGGSGGGVGGNSVADTGYGYGESGQGNRGGYLTSAVAAYGYLPSGGGGGKVETGRNATYYAGGRGGHGDTCDFSGSSLYYAGGGGGGCKWSTGSANNSAGGNGGGGAGKCRYQGNGGVGTHYKGGGGGGAGYGASGGRGGYGVIIIRYPTGADEASDGHLWMSFSFGFLVLWGILVNTPIARFHMYADHIRRNGLLPSIIGWHEDNRRYGLFWKQRAIRMYKAGEMDWCVIFDKLRKRWLKKETPTQVDTVIVGASKVYYFDAISGSSAPQLSQYSHALALKC